VSQPTFAQPVRRNLLVPVLLAFLLLGLALALVMRLSPKNTADLTILKILIYPTHTIFKSDSTVVGSDQVQDSLYVLATLRVEDQLRLPVYLKDFTATLITADGQQLTSSAIEKSEFLNLYTSFPALKPLASEPLLRDTMIAPANSAEGMIILHFPVTKEVWDHRQAAVLHVDLYHQGTQDILLTRTSEVTPTNPKPAPSTLKPAQP
jgi:hypothetical protein